jgi:hypothetical protein
LFTLVGIAGEDDLDAPDLGEGSPSGIEQPTRQGYSPGPNGRAIPTASAALKRRDDRKALLRDPKPILAADQSAALRDRLLAELERLGSADEATSWAYRSLGVKNTLLAIDAQVIEKRFQERLSSFGEGDPDGKPAVPVNTRSPAESVLPPANHINTSGGKTAVTPEGKSHAKARTPILGKTVRVRDKDHRKFVAKQACLVCGRAPSDAHHLRFAQPPALGRRVSDEFTVPLCRMHHRELHRGADEAAWWATLKIDPVAMALRLWQRTRPAGEPAAPSVDRESESAASRDLSGQHPSFTSIDANELMKQ